MLPITGTLSSSVVSGINKKNYLFTSVKTEFIFFEYKEHVILNFILIYFNYLFFVLDRC